MGDPDGSDLVRCDAPLCQSGPLPPEALHVSHLGRFCSGCCPAVRLDGVRGMLGFRWRPVNLSAGTPEASSMLLRCVGLDAWCGLEERLAARYPKATWRADRILTGLVRFAYWRI